MPLSLSFPYAILPFFSFLLLFFPFFPFFQCQPGIHITFRQLDNYLPKHSVPFFLHSRLIHICNHLLQPHFPTSVIGARGSDVTSSGVLYTGIYSNTENSIWRVFGH